MVVRFGNLSERLRDRIDSDIEILSLKNPQKKKFEKTFMNYFRKLEMEDRKTYNQILGLLVADTYKLLNVKKIDGLLTKEEIGTIEFYENFNNSTAVAYLEMHPNELLGAFYHMSEFNTFDYFMKRSVLVDSKDKAKFLCKLSLFSIYDYLYYCQKYELETLKAIYNEDVSEGYSKKMVIGKLVNTINELFTFDRENYKDIMIDLLTKYYLLDKNNLVKKNHYNTLVPYMECNDTQAILNYLTDDKIMFDVLKTYIDFDGDFSSLKVNNDDMTIQKIKKLKEI